MKKLLFTLFLGVSLTAYAQDYSVPAASPRAKIEQQFSISKIGVDYGRPAVKGRKIFGELVPYGKVWRAGANGTTRVSFGQSVDFGGKQVNAGSYGMHVIPQANDWKIVLNKDAYAWGSYTYDEKLNIAEIVVPVQKLGSKKEFFEIVLDPIDENTVNMIVSWDMTKVEVPIKVAKPDVVKKMAEQLQEVKKIEREGNKK